MPRLVDLAILRAQTDSFISIFPVTITLRRPGERVPTPSGGYRETPGTVLPAQVFTLLENHGLGQASPGTIQVNDGVWREVDFVLLGRYDADMRAGDTFELPEQPGRSFKLIEILHNNGWEKRGFVSRTGKDG